MALAAPALPNLVFSSGGTTSNAVTNLDDSLAISLFAPSALSGTVTVQVEPTTTGTAFVTLQSGGVDVSIAASKAIVLNPVPFRQLRLSSSVAEAATRTFTAMRMMPV